MQRKLLIIITVALLVSCGGASRRGAAEGAAEVQELTVKTPEPPAMLVSEDERARFMVRNWWRDLDFTDRRYIDAPATGDAFRDYAALAVRVTPGEGRAAVDAMMNAARADSLVYLHFATLADKYFYDPNSPFKNEELYITVLENLLAWDGVDELDKLRPRSQLRLALKNRVGTRAADFAFTTPTGAVRRFYGVQAPYVLLFIYNPGCPTCAQITEEMGASPLLAGMIGSGRLKVVAIYPDGDVDEWRAYLDRMPREWITGRDHAQMMQQEELYDVHAIPTLYLLDADKTVLLKDAWHIETIVDFMERHAIR